MLMLVLLLVLLCRGGMAICHTVPLGCSYFTPPVDKCQIWTLVVCLLSMGANCMPKLLWTQVQLASLFAPRFQLAAEYLASHAGQPAQLAK